jgi:hypothetical protein
MKKRILCLFLVLALCLCLGTMLVACDEPSVEQPPVEDPVPEEPETPEEPEVPEESEEGDKKGQFHPTPGAGGADVDIQEPNEQLPDSTLRG